MALARWSRTRTAPAVVSVNRATSAAGQPPTSASATTVRSASDRRSKASTSAAASSGRPCRLGRGAGLRRGGVGRRGGHRRCETPPATPSDRRRRWRHPAGWPGQRPRPRHRGLCLGRPTRPGPIATAARDGRPRRRGLARSTRSPGPSPSPSPHQGRHAPDRYTDGPQHRGGSGSGSAHRRPGHLLPGQGGPDWSDLPRWLDLWSAPATGDRVSAIAVATATKRGAPAIRCGRPGDPA